MVRLEAEPTPSVLKWARDKGGFSVEEVARRLKVADDRIHAWESGTEKPSIAQLRNLAEIYKRPLAMFYLDDPPVRFEAMHDFRRGSREGKRKPFSPELAFEIRRAHDRREWALELLKDIGEKPPDFTVRLRRDTPPEDAARELRKGIGISLEQQASWRSEFDAFRGWRGRMERAGAITFQATDVETAEARGFSIPAHPLPAIVVNIKDARRGRIFTMLHELVHLALNDGGICDLHDTQASDDVETYCNRVAGAVLFPENPLLSSDVVRNHPRNRSEWSDREIEELSRRFGGSREAVLVRLLNLRMTTWSFYSSKRAELLKQWAALRRKDGGFAPPHQISLASAGQLFTGLVIESFNQEKITASDVADFLQVRLKHLPEIQKDFATPNL